MHLHCLGGFGEVGRNAVLLETAHEKILLDYGLKVESGEMPLPIKGNINAIILCHPHLDHCGSVPTLYKKSQANIPFFATAATFDQTHLLWNDSMKVSKLKGKPQIFNEKNIEQARRHEMVITYGQELEIGHMNIEIHSAGHVPGSIMPVIDVDGKRILYTSDFNTMSTRLLNGADAKELRDIDVLIIESTYSAKEHPPREKTEKDLINIVEETIQNNGIALIPVFAVGRAAEIMMVLNSVKPKYSIYLDGMAREASEIALRYPELLRNPAALKDAMNKVIPLYTDDERKEAISEPCAIITTGGCLDGGPAVFYIKYLYNRPECSLIFTGFQIPKTAGRYLLDTGHYVTENMDLKVKMNMRYLDFSAHSGRTELFEFIKNIQPEHVICMHGDYCKRFATEIKSRMGIKAEAPENGEIVKI